MAPILLPLSGGCSDKPPEIETCLEPLATEENESRIRALMELASPRNASRELITLGVIEGVTAGRTEEERETHLRGSTQAFVTALTEALAERLSTRLGSTAREQLTTTVHGVLDTALSHPDLPDPVNEWLDDVA